MRVKAGVLRRILLFWTIFIGLGAVAGGAAMLIDPSGKAMGMDAMLPYFQVLPFASVVFQDFVFPGISLLIVNGATQLITFALLLMRKPCASKWSIACGAVLMAWICIQFVIFPLNFMSTIYFVFGMIEVVCGVALLRRERAA